MPATNKLEAATHGFHFKAPEGENQPSTEVDLFISTEKIMVLNTDLKEIMMDHGLRTISYIADIGELVVIMARRRVLPQVQKVKKYPIPAKKYCLCIFFLQENTIFQCQAGEEDTVIGTTPKMICHVFESEEVENNPFILFQFLLTFPPSPTKTIFGSRLSSSPSP